MEVSEKGGLEGKENENLCEDSLTVIYHKHHHARSCKICDRE